MKQELDPIINRLANNPKFGVTITNTENQNIICRNKTGAEMVHEAGSIQAFFNNLYTTGVQKIAIQPRSKNGSSWISSGDIVQLSFTSKDQSQAATAPVHVPTQVITQPDNVMGLMGSMNNGLMGGLQGQMIYHHLDYPKIAADNTVLKAENESLKEKVLELRTAAMEAQYSTDKSQGNKDMLNGLVAAFAPLLPMLAKGGAAAAPAGLNAPAVDESLPHPNQLLMQAVPAMPDYLAQYLVAIYQGVNNNEAFGSELLALLQKHNLITQ